MHRRDAPSEHHGEEEDDGSEGLAAVAVAVIAALAPGRTLASSCARSTQRAHSCAILANVGLEMLQDFQKAKAEPKANPFDVKMKED